MTNLQRLKIEFSKPFECDLLNYYEACLHQSDSLPPFVSNFINVCLSDDDKISIAQKEKEKIIQYEEGQHNSTYEDGDVFYSPVASTILDGYFTDET